MRRNIYSGIRVSYKAILLSIFLLLLLNILITKDVIADQGERLEIVAPEEVYEEEYFSISVMDPEIIDGSPWLIDVEIEFNGDIYQIDETAEVQIQAPIVDQDTEYTIRASKEGYNSTNTSITILNKKIKKLYIIPLDGWTVDTDQTFTVRVTDDSGNPVGQAEVAIQSFGGGKKTTDDDGKAWLIAPNDEWEYDKFTIIASKLGYQDGEEILGLNKNENFFQALLKNPYFPIFLGTIFLVFAIVFVNLRQRKSIYTRAKEISNDKTIEKYSSEIGSTQSDETEEKPESKYYEKEAIRVQPNKESKVEEIRISRPHKEKEVVPVTTDEDETEKVIKKKKMQSRDYDWFEGTDDIRYEIKKLTGEVDEEGLDKWFEGVDDLKDKIDKKMKKKDKKAKE